jgi:hypothetical protein
VPGQEKPLQPLDVVSVGLYAQDQWRVNDQMRVTFGARFDRPNFGDNGFKNAQVDAMNFRNAEGASVKYSTSKLPDASVLISPRVGFNWDVKGDRSFQVRGGTGVFTGRPAYVWISNQIGNNGILTGFEVGTNITNRPFHPDMSHYKPPASAITGAPAASYALALTEPDFKFPQMWRTNLAADRRLPWWGLVATGEFIYNRDVNGLSYINANLPAPDGNFTGADKRPRWNVDKCPAPQTQANQLNCNVTNAIVLGNDNKGQGWNVAASLEKPFSLGSYLKAGYAYGVQKTLVDPGSIASGTWQGNQITLDPNNPELAFSATSPGHRIFSAVSVTRNLVKWGETSMGLYWESRTGGNGSYTYAADANGDGGSSNDLIYIPKDASEMNFVAFTCTPTSGGCNPARTFTATEQAAAWDAYIRQDKYLSKHRGEYAERGAVFLPLVHRADLSLSQNVQRSFLGNTNSLQIRLDFLNFTNLLNSKWGVGQRSVSLQPLTNTAADGSGALSYRMRAINGALLTKTLEQTAGLPDVYRIQLTVRYNFN